MNDQHENLPLLRRTPSPQSSLEIPFRSVSTELPQNDAFSEDVGNKKATTDDDEDDDDSNTETAYLRPKVAQAPPPYVSSLSLEERRVAEKALVRKIDVRLILPIVVMYILNYNDRNAIASARLGGLEEDLNLQGSEYQTAVSILFVGYISMQVPSNLLMNKLGRPSLYLPIAMMVWGVVSASTATVHSFTGLVTVRFILGFAESPFFPGALFLLTSFYTREELALRTAILYAGTQIAGAFSGFLAAAVMKMDGIAGLRAWRWLFIFGGTVSFLSAFTCIFILPDMPKTTKWLTPEERELASWRLNRDIGQDDYTGTKGQNFFHGFILALKDIKVWIMTILLFSMVFSGSVVNFFPTVVQTLGYGRIHSLLLTVPPYILGLITCCLNAWHTDRTGEKYLHIILPLFVGIASFILAATTTSTIPRYVSMMLMIPGCFAGYVVALGWISSIIPRPPAKRAAAIAFINAVSNTSSIASSYLYPRSAAPGYVAAFVACSCSSLTAVATASVLRVILMRLNERLDRGEFVQDVVDDEDGDVLEESRRRGFRFMI